MPLQEVNLARFNFVGRAAVTGKVFEGNFVEVGELFDFAMI